MTIDQSQKPIAIVTGGSRGIGRSISERLLRDGYHVYMCARSQPELEKTALDLSHIGSIDYFLLNLTDKKAISDFINSWSQEIRVLVNNAGVNRTARIDEDEDSWDEVVKTNLDGMYFLTKGLVRFLADNGRIINISSQLGKEGRAGFGPYCASKFAVIGLTKCWAKELGERGITVNAVCPGWVKTEMAEKDLQNIAKKRGVTYEELYREICEPLELKRFTNPGEVADLVSFLVSDKACGITGQAISMHTIWNQE